eukprot:2040178-Amphidinium_carterae.1
MANHNSGTILAKASRDRSPTLPTTPMPTQSNGIQTMLNRTNPTCWFRTTTSSGTMTTIKAQSMNYNNL